jgi:aspartate aminotransferase
MNQLARQVAECLQSASWIRRMFEEGDRLRAQVGAENVFDFSLGNPHLEPPVAVLNRLQELATAAPRGLHRYMPNAGFPAVRKAMAAAVSKSEGCPVPPEHVVMTGGAASGLNVVLKALLDPGDSVVAFAPIFPEYEFYARNAGGTLRLAPTTDDFDLDVDALDCLIDDQTRVVLINSPNNPTGRVYPAATIAALANILRRHSQRRPRPIVLVSDEPYRRLVYDGVVVPPVFPQYPASILAGSFSKDLGLAGERIGYLAVHPDFPDAAPLLAGLVFCLRTLGFVNAPALWQQVVANCLDASVNVAAYEENRTLLYNGLCAIGYRVVKPQGAFYLFPQSPLEDDTAFVELLCQRRVLVVPGRGFHKPGYFRLSYAVEPELIRRALPQFAEAFRACAP